MPIYSCSTKVVLLPPVEAGQFRSQKFVLALTEAGLLGSMGRGSQRADNAAMESFFSLLQKNVLNRQRWDARGTTPRDRDWIERTYHRRRRQKPSDD